MKNLFTLKNSIFLIVLITLILIVATFIEKNYGVIKAWELIYDSIFLELLVYLIIVSLLFNIFRARMYKMRRLALLLIHISVILILVSSLITKKYSYQGKMYLSNQNSNDKIYNTNYEMDIKILKDKKEKTFTQKASKEFKYKFNFLDKDYAIENNYYLESVKKLYKIDKKNGKGVIDFDLFYDNKREAYLFYEFGRINKQGIEIVFNKDPKNKEKPYFKIVANEHQMIHFISNINIKSNFDEIYSKNQIHTFNPGVLYTIKDLKLMAEDIITLGKVFVVPDETKQSKSALFSTVKIADKKEEVILFQKDNHYTKYEGSYFTNKEEFLLTWSKKEKTLPFRIKLQEFKTIKYPGSQVVSSYESDISLISKDAKDFVSQKIKINKPLVYKNFTIFQTKNKIGNNTILHINYNPSKYLLYFAYFILSLALIINFFNFSHKITSKK